MPIRTLEKTDIPTITKAFNHAFSDYIIPMQMTEAMVARKFKGDQIDLNLSPGYFVDDELCGFIFHGIGKQDGQTVVWNGGTGVAPEHRGQGITSQLYKYILPVLQKNGYQQTVLEVIKGNDPAIHIYKKNGFDLVRQLECYKGKPAEGHLPQGVTFKTIEEIDWPMIHSLRTWRPTFQNNDHKIIAFREQVKIIGAFEQEVLLGYIMIVDKPDIGDVFQFAVKASHRKRGIGKSLFAKAAQDKSVPLKVINVDGGHEASNLFFEKIGFQKITTQFEMLKKI